MFNLTCQVWLSHNSIAGDLGLLASDAVLLDDWFWLLMSCSAFISGLSSQWRISAPWLFRTLGTSHTATQCHIPEDLNPCHLTCSFVFPGCDSWYVEVFWWFHCNSYIWLSYILILWAWAITSLMYQSFWWNKYRAYIIFMVATSAFYFV